MGIFRRKKNTVKNLAFSMQEKCLRTRHNFESKPVKYLGEKIIENFKYMPHRAARGGNQLVRASGKANTQMRSTVQMSGKKLGFMAKKSANQIFGKEFSSLINMVSKSKPQLPFLVGGGLMRLTSFSLHPNDMSKTEHSNKITETEKKIEQGSSLYRNSILSADKEDIERLKEIYMKRKREINAQYPKVSGERTVVRQRGEPQESPKGNLGSSPFNSFMPVRKAQSRMTVAVTGAASYSGKYITRLLQQDPNITEIRNFTNHPNRLVYENRNPYNVKTCPLNFREPEQMRKNFEGVNLLFQNYWEQFNHRNNENPAVWKIKKIIDACNEAGVKRVIYISHTQPKIDSNIGFIKAKAKAENYIKKNMLSYGFIRPNCIFGDTPNESVLINNICYLLKYFPLLVFPWKSYWAHIQPVHVRDQAEMAVNLGFDNGLNKNRFVDAVGPEKFKFFDFIKMLKKQTKSWSLIHTNPFLHPRILHFLTRPINSLLNFSAMDDGALDILCQDLACSKITTEEAKELHLWGKRSLSEWVKMNKKEIGKKYVSSFERYFDLEDISVVNA